MLVDEQGLAGLGDPSGGGRFVEGDSDPLHGGCDVPVEGEGEGCELGPAVECELHGGEDTSSADRAGGTRYGGHMNWWTAIGTALALFVAAPDVGDEGSRRDYRYRVAGLILLCVAAGLLIGHGTA